MRSKLLLAALFVWLAACGSPGTLKSDDYLVGRPPESYSAAYLWQGGDKNTVVALDKKGHTLQQFSLEPFAHQRSLVLPLANEEQGVLASADGGYFITTAEKDYAILRPDGTSQKNPVELLGNIKSIAYNPVQNLAVISDEFQSMALLVLKSDGTVLGSWKAGALFPGDKYVMSGAMLADGRLVLVLGTTTIAVVNVTDSVVKQAWQYTTFEVPDAKGMSWISAVPGQPEAIVVLDQTRLLSINVSQGAIVDQKDLSAATVLGKFRDYVPHVVSRATDAAVEINDVTYTGPDGKFVTRSLRGSSNQITQTLLDPTSDLLTIVYDPLRAYSSSYYNSDYYTTQQIYRFRLSDNLALDLSEIKEQVDLVVTPSFLFSLYPSALGKANRRPYGREPEIQTLEGYNLELFTSRYK